MHQADPSVPSADTGANPLMVEIIRSAVVESRHRGAAVVVDARGAVRAAWGDVARPIYPRSAMKALQGLAMVESGAVDALGLRDEQIALACASHNAEPAHVAQAMEGLDKLGLGVAALECGSHWPLHQPAAHALVRDGEAPSALHNNCSGKHVGMLTLAHQLRVPGAGYTEPQHAVQQRIQTTLESMCEIRLAQVAPGVDGCSAPNWPIPLQSLAFGFARFADPATLSPTRRQAIERIREAVFDHPFMVAGSDRFCTQVMRILGRRAFIKTGAEGVFCAALPEQGLGIALKCDDGAGRGAQVMMAALLKELGAVSDDHLEAMQAWLEPEIRNCNGRVVGKLRSTLACR